MRFKTWLNTDPSAMNDYLCWMASDNGTNYYGDCAWGNSSGWFEQVLDLENVSDYPGGDMTGKSQVWVGLWFHSDASTTYMEGAHVDDIILRKCVGGGCPASASGGPPAPAGSRVHIFPATITLP
jgi:hypothetical protein